MEYGFSGRVYGSFSAGAASAGADSYGFREEFHCHVFRHSGTGQLLGTGNVVPDAGGIEVGAPILVRRPYPGALAGGEVLRGGGAGGELQGVLVGVRGER